MSFDPSLKDVSERRVAIRAEMDALRTEDGELEIAERVLASLANRRATTVKEGNAFADALSAAASAKRDTVEELLVAALAHSEGPWWTSGKLKDHVSEKAGRDIPMGTIGPTLSNMKSKGTIVRDGFRVALAQRVPGIKGDDGDLAIETDASIAAE